MSGKIVLNKNLAVNLSQWYMKSMVYGTRTGGNIDAYVQRQFIFCTQEYIDFVKRVNAWLKTSNADWLADTTATKADGTTLYTGKERQGLALLLNPHYYDSIEDNWLAYIKVYEEQGLISSIEELKGIMGKIRIYPVETINPAEQPDGSYLFNYTTALKIIPSAFIESECNPNSEQMYLYKNFSFYNSYTNYAFLAKTYNRYGAFAVFKDLSVTDRDRYYPQLAWNAWTVGLPNSGVDLEFDHVDKIEYIDGLKLRVTPPFVLM